MTTALVIGIAATYLVVWFISWKVVAGWFYAVDQRKFPSLAGRDRKKDAHFARWCGALYALLGPLGVFIAFAWSDFGFYGWLRPGSTPSSSAAPGSGEVTG